MENIQFKPKVNLTIIVKDENGNIINKIERQNDPLTRWALRSLYSFMTEQYVYIKYEDGRVISSRFSNAPASWMYKIAIGTDATPFTMDDYRLYQKERERGIIIGYYKEEDSIIWFDLKTDFFIETDKTYYEFGLFGRMQDFAFLVCRDVITDGVSVPANNYLTIIYRIILGTV